jgi:hypothetical protein
MSDEFSPGSKSSEYSLSTKAIAALVVSLLGAIGASGLIPDDHVAVKIMTALVGVSSALGIGKVASSYSSGRSAVKVAQAAARKLPRD